MKVSRPKTDKYHNWDLDLPNEKYFKKGFWKRFDRKKFFRNLLKQNDEI